MERSLFELKLGTRWVATRLDVYRELDSTNLRAEQLAAGGAPEGTLVVADRQSAGRGRLGRSFWSPGGRSLYMSLLLRPRQPAEHVQLNVFAAAAAVAETAAASLPPGVTVEIKWPNDVLLDGLKTSGINLPAQLDGERVVLAVLGIGVNVNVTRDEIPEELRTIATSLCIAGGRPLCRVEFAERLLRRLETKLDKLATGDAAAVLDDWRKYFRMQGSRVRIGGPGVSQEVEGVIEDIDADGALRLRTAATTERVLAGDVTVLQRGT